MSSTSSSSSSTSSYIYLLILLPSLLHLLHLTSHRLPGAAVAAGTAYTGALIVTRDGQWPEGMTNRDSPIYQRIERAMDVGGNKMWELFQVERNLHNSTSCYEYTTKFTPNRLHYLSCSYPHSYLDHLVNLMVSCCLKPALLDSPLRAHPSLHTYSTSFLIIFITSIVSRLP